MPTYVYFILIYVLIILIALLVFWLASKITSLFFAYKTEEAKSLKQPIIKGLTVLVTVYFLRHHYGGNIVNAIVAFINETLGTTIKTPRPDNPELDTLETIILYVIVGTIIVTYIIYAYAKKEVQKEQAISAEPRPVIKIDFPDDPPSQSPIFHERLKRLFELKFEKETLQLSYDKEYAVLFGTHKYGLHQYCTIIYCEETVNPKLVSESDLDNVLQKLKNASSKYQSGSAAEVIEYYYLLERGSFAVSKDNIHCYTEDSFLNNIIDFKKYLEKLVHNFNNEKLPFSYSNDDTYKFSLGTTFIQPRYVINNFLSQDPLNAHLNQWLAQSNKKHFVLLGDYGMGKSTYMKYYACYLGDQILTSQTVIRYPVLISLTNTSPRHGGINNSIGKFVSDHLGVSRALFNELINRGKIIFLLDGFDEMGYVGTHEQRVKQLNAIWQLATKNNKILISGRPSYFPTEQELIESFNIKVSDDQLTPQEKPFFERIELKGLDNEQIKESISLYNYPVAELNKYLDFIFSNSNIIDLCRRPSMMHIIREMLPKLYSEHSQQALNATNLMTQYIEHWITRQLEKGIVSAVEDKKKKKEFVWELFIELASDFFTKGLEKQGAEDIIGLINDKMESLKLIEKNDIEGFETEILSGFFIEIEDSGYRFVHKSFKEFFVSKKIILLMEERALSHPIFTDVIWNKEINDFVYDHFEIKDQNPTKFPLLLEKYRASDGYKRMAFIGFVGWARLYNKAGKNKKRRYFLLTVVDAFDSAGRFYFSVITTLILGPSYIGGIFGFFLATQSIFQWENTIVNYIAKGVYYEFLRDNKLAESYPITIKYILNRFNAPLIHHQEDSSQSL